MNQLLLKNLRRCHYLIFSAPSRVRETCNASESHAETDHYTSYFFIENFSAFTFVFFYFVFLLLQTECSEVPDDCI
ncbi:unnamed protein product [Brassica rapa subsp. trilocularis]